MNKEQRKWWQQVLRLETFLTTVFPKDHDGGNDVTTYCGIRTTQSNSMRPGQAHSTLSSLRAQAQAQGQMHVAQRTEPHTCAQRGRVSSVEKGQLLDRWAGMSRHPHSKQSL